FQMPACRELPEKNQNVDCYNPQGDSGEARRWNIITYRQHLDLLLPWIEPRLASELFPKLSLRISNAARHFHFRRHYQVAIPSSTLRKAPPAHAQLLPGLRRRRNANVDSAIERWHRNVSAQNRLPGRKIRFVNKVMVFHLEVRMFGQSDPEI